MTTNTPIPLGESETVAVMRDELEKLRAQQNEIMRLVGTTQPERLLHDIRNLLQERIFLLAACESMQDDPK